MSTLHVVALAWPVVLVGAGLVIGRVLRRADRSEAPGVEESREEGAAARTPRDPVAPDVPAER